jgi:hypothetical protein
MSQEERSIFWEGTASVILGKNLYTYMCPILSGLRDRAISLYNSKTVDKKEILRTVSNTGIYCSRDKVGAVYLVQYVFKISNDNINAICKSCEDMARCSSVQ